MSIYVVMKSDEDGNRVISRTGYTNIEDAKAYIKEKSSFKSSSRFLYEIMEIEVADKYKKGFAKEEYASYSFPENTSIYYGIKEMCEKRKESDKDIITYINGVRLYVYKNSTPDEVYDAYIRDLNVHRNAEKERSTAVAY